MTGPTQLERRVIEEQKRALSTRDDLPDVRARLIASIELRQQKKRRPVALYFVLVAALAPLTWIGARAWVGGVPEPIHASPETTARSSPLAPSNALSLPTVEPPSSTPVSPTASAVPREIVIPRVLRPEPFTPPPPASASTAEPAVSAAPPVWRSLAIRGRYREALTEAEAIGFDTLCQSSPANELLMLANAARFGGRLDRARQALLSLRDRFPAAPERVVATFTLGRMAADDQHDDLAAAHWFGSVVDESAGGDLAQEALGRLVECLDRGGDHPTARRHAASYLSRFPNGPHAPNARRVLER